MAKTKQSRLRRKIATAPLPNRGAKTRAGFVQENVAKGAIVRTDGWQGYDELAALGYSRKPLLLDGGPEKTMRTCR